MIALNLKRLAQFVMVADSVSLSAAARRIGMSQSALTQSIRTLEEEIGFELFDREHGFSLTAVGNDFLDRARELVARARVLEFDANLLRTGHAGSLNVLCGTTMAETLVPPALAQIARERPHFRVKLQVREIGDAPALLRSRQIDLAVIEYTLFEQEPDLRIVPLPPQEIVFVCRSGHPLAQKRRKFVPLEEFFSYPLVATFLPGWAVQWMRENHPEGLDQDGLTISCNHFAVLRAVVKQSDAVTGIPERVVRQDLEAGTLTRIRLDTPPLSNQAGVVFLRERALSPAAQYLVEALQAVG